MQNLSSHPESPVQLMPSSFSLLLRIGRFIYTPFILLGNVLCCRQQNPCFPYYERELTGHGDIEYKQVYTSPWMKDTSSDHLKLLIHSDNRVHAELRVISLWLSPTTGIVFCFHFMPLLPVSLLPQEII